MGVESTPDHNQEKVKRKNIFPFYFLKKNKMKNIYIAIIIGIVLISTISAMYAGECIDINLSSMESLENLSYTVVGNSSNLEGLIITLNGTNATICTALNYKPDTFTIIFFSNKTTEIIKEVQEDCEDCEDCDCGGRSTKIVYQDKEVIKYVDRTPTDFISEPINLDNPKNNSENIIIETINKIKWYYYLIAGLIILGLFFFLFKFLTKDFEEDDFLDEEQPKDEDIPKEIVKKEDKELNNLFKDMNLESAEDVTP